MTIHTGRSISEGIAIGRILFYQKDKQAVTQMKIQNPEMELNRFEKAKQTAAGQLADLYQKSAEEVGVVNAKIFEAYQMFLEDIEYNEFICNRIRDDKVNAEYAVAEASDKFSQMFAVMKDEDFRSKEADVKDVSMRIIRILSGNKTLEIIGNEPVIVAAEDFTPSEIIQMHKEKVLAFVSEQGTSNSHAAILARTRNIPALSGIEIQKKWQGKMAIVDGKQGVFYVDPDEDTLKKYVEEYKKMEESRESLNQLKGLPDVTTDGKEMKVYANISNEADVKAVLESDAAGIGLFRSEFLYLEKDHYPSEDEQFAIYKKVVQKMTGKKVVIRTLDIGADKQADYFQIEHEKNPALGYRGIRVCFDRMEIFKTQLHAIYRASAFGTVSILFPMIISADEVLQLKKICAEVRSQLDMQGISYGEVELGIMIETPAAVMISDMLAKEVDFFSIGTNDLTQYALAIDRQNPKLESIYDSHHPGILRMIQMVIDNGHKEGCKVGICGELAADLTLTETFVKMGVDELSVSPTFVLPVRKRIREM